MAYCGNCGEVQREGDRFCGNCGAPTSIASPPRLGGYDLLGVLGRGATATVYLARDPTTGERLALQVLDPVVLGLPGARERLDQEVAVLASLRDPHLVGVRSIGEDAGRPFVAMDFVEGASLREIERRAGRLSPEQALGVLEGALRGLSRAHAKGIVHGDVKPENILVDREGTSKLVDFGHAFGTQGATAGGTPAYMSPEACRNLPQDRRSDLYSLGVVLYEALSGHVPFEAQSDAAVMRMHVSDPPPPIERLPGELGALLARALAKDPDDRPQSADAFLADLEAAAAGAYGRDWRRRAVVAGLVAGATAGVLTSASSAAAATAPSVPNSEGAKEPAQREPARHAGSTLSRSASPVRRALGFFSAHAVPTSVVAVIVVGAAVTAGVLSIHTRPSQSSIPRHQALATRIVASSTTTTTEPNSATTTIPSTSTTITPPVSTAPPTRSPATVISADAALSSDLHCSSLKIDSGVTLITDGFNIYCSGAVTNDGTIVTGADNDSANFPASYGGSGGGGAPAGPCGPPQVGQPGHSTMASGGQGGVSCNTPSTSENGSTPSRPTVTAATVAAWETAGMRQYLEGAGGGNGYMRTCAGERGSPGAYGIAIEGSSVKVGTIDATGVAGVYSGCSGSGGGGGGGAVLIATDPGGYTPGTVNVSGGAAGNQAGAGGNGQLIVVTTDLRNVATAPKTAPRNAATAPSRATGSVTNCHDSGPGSLRTAVQVAKPGATIRFSLSPRCRVITLTSGRITIPVDLTIDGPGANALAVSGDHTQQIFLVPTGVRATISRLTLEDGSAPSCTGTCSDGGAIENTGTLRIEADNLLGNAAPSSGGAIHNLGTLAITDSTFYANTSHSGGAIANDQGGHSLTITHSTISDNEAAYGGGIDTYYGSTTTVTDSTLTANRALGTICGSCGGAVGNDGGTTRLVHDTIWGNYGGYGGGVFNGDTYVLGGAPCYYPTRCVPGGGSITLVATIVANNAGGDCHGPSIVDGGYNLVSDGSCDFSHANHSLSGTPAGLRPGGLRSNGGPTETIAPEPGSPAVARVGLPSLCRGTDQRGVPWPRSHCNIGAY